jgi:hypothetical protein
MIFLEPSNDFIFMNREHSIQYRVVPDAKFNFEGGCCRGKRKCSEPA